MTLNQIIAVQKRIGTTPDGFWGPKSIAACQRHLRSLMPAITQWPKPTAAALQSFYGSPGDESNLVSFDFPFPMFYEGKRVLRSRCHRKVKTSLLRILTEIGDRWSDSPAIMDNAEDYGGIYNYRPMRGGSSLSMHSWGIAIDLDADDNGNKTAWPVAADMPIEIMEVFSREGWMSAGAFWGRDAMHFQATQ
jgi:hypothetical protein